jgi:hypothetical protein
VLIAPKPIVTLAAQSICYGTGLVKLTGGLPAGGVYAGTGVVNDTMFDPVLSGLGAVMLTYTYTDPLTGCSNSKTGNVYVRPIPAPVISGLDTAYCLNDPADYGYAPGYSTGTFSGPGIVGKYFHPSLAGPGWHTITFTYTNNYGCTGYDTKIIHVKSLPVVNFPTIGTVLSTTAPYILTTATPAGGTYSGPGVTGSLFNPGILAAGPHILNYTYTSTASGCTNGDTSLVTIITPPPPRQIGGIDAAAGLAMYPNPTNSMVSLRISGMDAACKLEIFDVLGRLSYSEILPAGTLGTELNVSRLPNGVYQVRVSSGKQTLSGRLMIEH